MDKVLLYIIAASALCAVSSAVKRQYHFIYDPKNWTEARSYCRDQYTDLVTVNTSAVVTLLNSKAVLSQLGFNKDAWIGLYYDVISWKWSLSDKDFYSTSSIPNAANYRYFAGGEPNSYWYTGDCTCMYDSGLWNDAPCEWTYNPICADTNGTNVTFVFINRLMSWPDAQIYCRDHHTDMASVRSFAENEKIRTLKPAGLIVWIGLYKDTWKWSNGPMYVFRNWQWAPRGGLYKCTSAAFASFGYWQDWTCDVKKAFICHHDPVPFSRHIVKVKLETNPSLDLNDPAVLDDLQMKLEEKLKEQGVTADITLSWKTQSNGNIFFEDKKDQKYETDMDKKFVLGI